MVDGFKSWAEAAPALQVIAAALAIGGRAISFHRRQYPQS
jgi:hypothetical protein